MSGEIVIPVRMMNKVGISIQSQLELSEVRLLSEEPKQKFN